MFFKVQNNPQRTSMWVVFFVILLGIFFRFNYYIQRESFWKDEVGLAQNFLIRDLSHIHEKLINCQAAPIGFSQISKLAEMSFGHNEHTFWLLPLILGCSSLLLAAAIWKNILPLGAWVIAISILAFNTTLIDHIAQFKPYLSDSFFSLLMLGAFFYQRQNIRWGWPIYLFTGLLCLWMSYTSVFVIAGLGLWQIIEAIRKKDKETIIRSFVYNALLGLVFITLWFINYNKLDADGQFKRFWTNNFAPFILRPEAFNWYSNNLGSVFGYLFGQTQWSIILFFIALGIARAWGLNKVLMALLVPIAVTFIASWVGAYPVYDRLVIFWVPLLVPLFALGIYAAWEYFHKQHRGMTVLFVLFVALPLLHPINALSSINDPQEIKQAALFTSKQIKPGDAIYVHEKAVENFKYYFKRYPLPQGVSVTNGTRQDLEDLHEVISKLYPGKRVYFLYTEPIYQINEIVTLAAQEQALGNFEGILELNYAGVIVLKMK